ncbi:TetR/AcrR family transcriptional regulator [Novosphingobium sp. PY1]|uniref:TetR/AcrR family transcriptional regulator n=1 Tax=Novosphingobium sp. PY1 TaxID=1882221 RepID=UPI001A8D0CEF|nr:TetR/AcrR family transcriptional regulator [Novosphingobium sp. PY1]
MSDQAEVAKRPRKTTSRTPQQSRSKAALERMLAAARALMLERGSEEFTLMDVEKLGNVSIGSIYLRFNSKENLVRAVITDALAQIEAAEDLLMNQLMSKATNLGEFIPPYTDGFAEILKGNAPILRLSMQKAANDPLIAESGQSAAQHSVMRWTQAITNFSDEIVGLADMKIFAAYQIIYSVLARGLNLSPNGGAEQHYQWDMLKRELGKMVLAYLHTDN